jgi:TonB family protein
MVATVTPIPQHRRLRAGIYGCVVVLHIAVIGVLIWALHRQPVRYHTAGSPGTIAAYVQGPVGTTGRAPTPAPKKTPSRVMRAAVEKPEPPAGSGQSQGDAQGTASGPVRLGSGEGLTLLHKVIPIYPRLLETARMAGMVVLDAVIHQDGTIGDVRVLQATNDQFAQAAIVAVKQWRYSPIPYEGIVTVNVNFTLPH